MQREEEYKLKVDYLRSIREKNRARFLIGTIKMANLLESLSSDSSSSTDNKEIPIIKFSEMMNFELGIWMQINEETYLRLEESTEHRLKFSLTLKEGAKMALIKHDSIHSIIVNEGKLLDLYNNKTYLKGEEVIYLEYEPHEHATDEFSRFTVYHTKIK